jgi:hypothetical protein
LEAVQTDLSALADFDPVDLAQLASWGSIDANADTAALAAVLAAGLPAGTVTSSALAAVEAAPAALAVAAEALAEVPAEGTVAEGGAAEADKPAGAEPTEPAKAEAVAEVDGTTSGLQGLSLGAGFE